MRIKTLATLTGASQKAIRHYEALGLLGPVPRRGRYRAFGPTHVERVSLVRRAQRYGFTLAELGAVRGPGQAIDWAALLGLVQRKRGALAAERARLAALEAELAAIADELAACDTVLAAQAAAPCLMPGA